MTTRRTGPAAWPTRPSPRRPGSCPPTATSRAAPAARTATTPAICRAPTSRTTARRTCAFTTDAWAAADVVGKALILHAGRNNFGNVPVGSEPNQYTPNSEAATTLTANTGNSGDRIACGVLERRG